MMSLLIKFDNYILIGQRFEALQPTILRGGGAPSSPTWKSGSGNFHNLFTPKATFVLILAETRGLDCVTYCVIVIHMIPLTVTAPLSY